MSNGGYCDCGDEEVWKSNASCNVHMANDAEKQMINVLKKLPIDLVIYVFHLFLNSLAIYLNVVIFY